MSRKRKNSNEEVTEEPESLETKEEIVKKDNDPFMGMSPSQFMARQENFDRLHFRYQDDPEEGTVFEEKSQTIHCPYCDTRADSLVDYKLNILGYFIALILMLGLGWLSFCILPFVLSLTKSAVHRCSKCLNEVKNNSFLGFNSMEDKVISFNIGQFGVALSRKYLLYITMTLVAAALLFVIMETKIDVEFETPISNITWDKYVQDCGINAYKNDRMKAVRAFDFYY